MIATGLDYLKLDSIHLKLQARAAVALGLFREPWAQQPARQKERNLIIMRDGTQKITRDE
jgi:hypothetical protein